jgi:hypothetical protein
VSCLDIDRLPRSYETHRCACFLYEREVNVDCKGLRHWKDLRTPPVAAEPDGPERRRGEQQYDQRRPALVCVRRAVILGGRWADRHMCHVENHAARTWVACWPILCSGCVFAVSRRRGSIIGAQQGCGSRAHCCALTSVGVRGELSFEVVAGDGWSRERLFVG